jgi:hypothetical protein
MEAVTYYGPSSHCFRLIFERLHQFPIHIYIDAISRFTGQKPFHNLFIAWFYVVYLFPLLLRYIPAFRLRGRVVRRRFLRFFCCCNCDCMYNCVIINHDECTCLIWILFQNILLHILYTPRHPNNPQCRTYPKKRAARTIMHGFVYMQPPIKLLPLKFSQVRLNILRIRVVTCDEC